MPKDVPSLLRFNAGEVSTDALARIDLERMPFSAHEQVNWRPTSLGSMSLRPGLRYLASTHTDAAARLIPFIYATSDTALIEMTPAIMRVWINDAPLTRPSVTTTITNGDFSSGTGWTLTPTDGATATISGGKLNLTALARGSSALAKRQTTVPLLSIGVEHGLRIVVDRGPVLFRCGSTEGGDEYITETSLATGTHSLAFTPSGDFWVQFVNRDRQLRIVDQVQVESAGAVALTTPWGASDLSLIRYAQSADVIFVACKGYRQRKLERRGIGRSWSIVEYLVDDGPFTDFPTAEVKLKPSVTEGNGTLTADAPFFRPGHVGTLFRLDHEGQVMTFNLAAGGTETEAIRVTGIASDSPPPDDRNWTFTRSGTWTATISLQRSYDGGEDGFIQRTTFTTNGTTAVAGAALESNLVIHHRAAIREGDYTSGTAALKLDYDGGGGYGLCRVVGYTSSTVVDIEVLRPMRNTKFTDDWREGEWSDVRGWPTAVAFHEGRLFWSGGDRLWGSVSDAFGSFDAETEGDSGPISRSLGSGPVDTINWILALQRLIVGTEGAEPSVRASSFDEPLTPTNVTIKDASTQGSARVQAAKVDASGLFVSRDGALVYELRYDSQATDYSSDDLTQLNPEIGAPSIVELAVQRKPETYVHFVRSDGVVALLLYNLKQNVVCWTRVETDGDIEAAAVLPGPGEDQVYYVVERVINGLTKRFVEKWAMKSECVGGNVNKIADAHAVYSGAAATTITGLSHLEAEEVVVWADGRDVGTKTVASGQITLDAAASNVVAGLHYRSRYKSTKLAYAVAAGTALLQKKQVGQLGMLLRNTHYQGVTFGPDFDHLDPLPLSRDGEVLAADTILADHDEETLPFPGSWDTDSRICLEANAPRPCTVLALVFSIETNTKA